MLEGFQLKHVREKSMVTSASQTDALYHIHGPNRIY